MVSSDVDDLSLFTLICAKCGEIYEIFRNDENWEAPSKSDLEILGFEVDCEGESHHWVVAQLYIGPPEPDDGDEKDLSNRMDIDESR